MKIYRIAKLSVLQIAQNIRNSFIDFPEDEDDNVLAQMCLQVSRKLRDELKRNGYNAFVVRGTFTVDNPDAEACSELDPNDFECDEELQEAMNNPLHYWVELDGQIIDLTADQFNKELSGEKMGKITIGAYSNFPRYVYGGEWL
jgi:hypothetical protein